MQFLVISHQLLEIAWAILLGSLLGAVYDGIRFLRMLVRPLGCELVWINVLDAVYGIVFGAVYCIFIFSVSSGHFRWFTFLGAVVGFFLWRFFPSRLLLPVLSLMSKLIHGMLGLIIFPLRLIVSAFINALKGLYQAGCRKRFVRKTETYKKQLLAEVILINGE